MQPQYLRLGIIDSGFGGKSNVSKTGFKGLTKHKNQARFGPQHASL